MPEPRSSIQAAAELRRRAERFASLRAGQRALSRAVHPSELARANQQGRDLVIQLQELSARVRGAEGELEVDGQALARIDGLLDETSRRLYEILDRIDIPALRSIVPPLLSEHPEDVRGLVDVLAEGELRADQDLRKLEYLVTMLCTEERDGRRVVVREPGDLSTRLREATRERGGSDEAAAERERRLGDAIAQLLHGSADVGGIRDEMRQLKEEMGPGLLHPRVFTATMAYNVAMSNQVAGLVDGSRSIDRLAEDLLAGPEAAAAAPSAADPALALPSDPLGSATFESLVAAFRARVSGGEAGSAEARRVVEACPVDGLIPMELEAFEQGEDGETARLTRAAVVLGLVCRNLEAVDAPLRALGLDPDLLASDGVAAVMREMAARARKLFADSEYDAAFRVSEIKTRNLAKLTAARAVGPGAAAPRSRPVSRASVAGTEVESGWGISPQQLLLGGLAALALLAAVLWLPSGWSGEIYPQQELARISPFLESGYRDEQAGGPVFVGRLHPSWDHLGTPERRAVATRIGRSFEDLGIPGVTLSDALRRRQAEWRAGDLRFLAQRPGGS